jgi:hypothetical protein
MSVGLRAPGLTGRLPVDILQEGGVHREGTGNR